MRVIASDCQLMCIALLEPMMLTFMDMSNMKSALLQQQQHRAHTHIRTHMLILLPNNQSRTLVEQPSVLLFPLFMISLLVNSPFLSFSCVCRMHSFFESIRGSRMGLHRLLKEKSDAQFLVLRCKQVTNAIGETTNASSFCLCI